MTAAQLTEPSQAGAQALRLRHPACLPRLYPPAERAAPHPSMWACPARSAAATQCRPRACPKHGHDCHLGSSVHIHSSA